MIVQKTSLFPASKETVFRKLQQLETLQTIAKPYATFEPIGDAVSTWAAGSTSAYRFRLFGVIPFGTHRIHIVRFDPGGISSREGNEHVPVWNHDILLVETDENHTRYTDRVEIHVGWKTPFIWLWAKAFYAHRQRKWGRLLNAERIEKANLPVATGSTARRRSATMPPIFRRTHKKKTQTQNGEKS